MGEIEDTKPTEVLATKVWSGTHWYYPHIEAMIDRIKFIRNENQELLRDVRVLQNYVRNQQRANDALLLEQGGADESGWEEARIAFDESLREMNNSGALTRWGGGGR